MKNRFKRALILLLAAMCLLAFPAAGAASVEELPGQELWQSYLDKTEGQMQSFAQDPFAAFRTLLPESPLGMLSRSLQNCADALLFLLLASGLSFLMDDAPDGSFLDLGTACGCGILLWNDLTVLAQFLCEKMLAWRTFLLGFLPVYGGVLTAGGEFNAGAAASGTLLSGLCMIAQGVALWAEPLLKSYLAVSIACGISTQGELSSACRATGVLLQKGLIWAGKAFGFLLGIQRMVTFQLDHSATRVGQLLTASIPVVGQALGTASEILLSSMKLLKGSLGVAAILIVGAEFVPLYLWLLLYLLLLSALKVLADLAGNKRCAALLGCFVQAVRCMAAVTAVFFELVVVGVMLMICVGGM